MKSALQKIPVFIATAIFFLFCFKQADASHIMGSDITYKCVGTKKYEVTLTVYRDCGGTSLLTFQSLRVECTSSTWWNNYTLTYLGAKDITGLSTGCTTKSKCATGGTFAYGIEEHTFKVTVDLSAITCTEFLFSWSQAARNNTISTGAAAYNFYTEARVNATVGCNSSPIFTSPAASLICAGSDFVFNNGALDLIDIGDSLSYQLVAPLQSKGSPTPFAGSWSATKPLTFLGFPNATLALPSGFHLDSITGDLAFRPTVINQIAVIVLEVTEWRNVSGTMTKVGVTRRDIQVIIIDCNTNVPPVISGVSKETCPGQQVCVNVTTSDANNDSVKLSWNAGIPGATFTKSSNVKWDSAKVCWTPSISDVSTVPYTFTLTAKDNYCPLPGSSTRGFTIFVYDPPAATTQTLSLGCGHVKVNFTPNKNYTSLTQLWEARDTLGNLVSSSTRKADTLLVPKGKVIVRLTLKALGDCVTSYSDTLIIPEHVEVHAITSDTMACQNKQINITSYTVDGIAPFHYVWNTSPNDTLTTLTLDTAKGRKYWITVTDGVGCTWWDSVRVRWDTIPVAQFSPSPVCRTAPITFNNTTIAAQKDTFIYTWRFDDTGSSTLKSPVRTFSNLDTFVVKLKVETDKGCKDSTQSSIIVHPKPTALFTTNDTDQCLRGNQFVYTNQSNITYGSINNKWFFGDGDSSAAVNPVKTFPKDSIAFKVKLITTSDKLCTDSAFATMVVFPDPKAKFNVGDTDQCLNGNLFGYANTSTIKSGSNSYRWFFGDADSSFLNSPTHTYPTHGIFTTSLIATSNKGCRDTAKRQIVVFPKPMVAFATNDTDQCINGNNFSYTNQTNIASGTMTYNWAAGDGNTGTATNYQRTYLNYSIYNVKLKATSDKGCRDSIIKQVAVRPMPKSGFTTNDSTQCVNDNLFAFTNTSTVPYGTLQYQWDFGNGKFGTTADTAVNYQYDSTFRPVLKAITQYGCTDTFGRYVIVHSKPMPSFTINDSTQCVNADTFIFTNTSTIKLGSMVYRWYFGTGDSNIAIHSQYQYTKDSTYNVKLKLISNFRCTDSVAHNVVVYPKPKADYAVNDSMQCLNINQYAFTNASTAKYGGLRYLWNFGDGRTSAKADTALIYSKDTVFKVTLISYTDDYCYDTVSRNMTLHPVPQMGFQSNDSTQCLNTNQFKFTNNCNIKLGTMTYEWTFGNEGTDVVPNPVFVFSKDTLYSVKLKATSDQLCTDSMYKTIDVYPVPKPAFVINDSSQCVNTDLFTFTNQTLIKYGTMQYNWFFGDGDSLSSVNPAYGYEADDVYRVTLKAISNHDCIDSAYKQLTVLAKPAAGFSIDDSSQCVNPGVFAFTNKTTIKYATPLYYWWDFDNTITTTQQDTSITYGVNGEYHPTLIARTGDNCYDTFSRLVLVYPKPYADFTIDNDSQCVHGNVFGFTNTTTIDSGLINYTWKFGDGNTDNTTSPSHSYATDTTYTVQLKAVSDFGCRDSITHQLVVIPKPVIDFTINDSGQCVNSNSFVFSNKATVKYGTLTYNWDFANGKGCNCFDTLTTYTYDSTYRVVLRATSNFGCTDTGGRYVIVHSKPTPGYTVDDSAQCLDSNKFAFTNASTIKTGTYSSIWTFSDGQSATTQDAPGIKFDNPINYAVKLLLTSNFNCKDSIAGQVIVYPHPNPDFIGLSKYYCTDYPVFALTPTVPGGTFTGKNMAGYNYTPNTVGLDTVHYRVQVNGCFNDTTKYTIVHPLPVLNLGMDTTLCQREPIFLNAGFPNSTYRWQDGVTTPIYKVMWPGTYKVTMYNLCDTLTDEIKVTYRDYDCNHFFPSAFTPNHDGVNDVFYPYLENATEIYLTVYDRWGGVVFESKELNKGWDGTINGEAAPIGAYVWHVEAMFNNLGFTYSHAENGTVTLVR